MIYDVLIVGGGPAGLNAALNLGRARRRVLLCDAGPPRNAAAKEVHGFVTRDGTPPAEFRRVAREQLAEYASVEVRDTRVLDVRGERGAFEVELSTGTVQARRVLLCTGMVDEPPELPGYRELWGKAIFQCPYCHGWEVRDRAFGCLATAPMLLDFAIFLRAWTDDVVAFTDGQFEVPADLRERLAKARVRLEERKIRGLIADGDHLAAVELEGGERVPRAVLFAKPPQRQTELVRRLGLDLDEHGFVRVSEHQETSRPGIFAGGDLATPMQAAVMAAAAGAKAAAMLNHGLVAELVASGEI